MVARVEVEAQQGGGCSYQRVPAGAFGALELFSILTGGGGQRSLHKSEYCTELNTHTCTQGINKISGWHQCPYPGCDTLSSCKMLPSEETGRSSHRLCLYCSLKVHVNI